ncbi:MAG: DUF2723 domain-containing protein, partial [Candidatus Altiarchaeota archaeon]|nr:DUF2723 domain-containing protein [Candidatus Altiarchaeota archaeon]
MKKKHEIIACFVVFLASIGVYTATLCPTVYSGDSGDLITSSYTLGVPHPTGYPLYVFIGKAFSYLPVGPVAYRYNLMSAFFAAATASIVCAIVLSNTKNNLAGVGAGLLTAYAKTIWDQATIAEVYTLHAFLLAATLFLILKWRREKHKKILYIAAATYGLAMTNHISTLIYLPAYAYLVLNDGWKKKRKINWELVTASFLAPLTLYLYIPIKASQKPVYNWGNPDTPIKFIDHITGAVHRRTQMLTLPKEEILERFFKIIWSMSTQVHACILLVIIGLYRHGKTQMEYAKFTGLFVCLDVVYSLFINDVSLDITSFGIPSIVVLMVWSGYGLSDALDYIKARYKRYEYSILAIASVCLLVVAVNWWECDKS